ncbi:MAG TPA: hypothetical protein PK286_09010, partial [Devosia sp.]|nr:hypothetical protein [Devosia sp.]
MSPPPSAVYLPDGVPHRRPRFSLRRRPQAFHDAFDARALFYDCFRHHDGRRVLLVGPPPVNLDYGAIGFAAGATKLAARFHSSLSVTVTELLEVPENASEIAVSFGDARFTVPVRSNRCADFAGTRTI